MIKKMLHKIVPRIVYEPVKRSIFIRSLRKQIEAVRKVHGYCIVFIATPLHGNLGDHAIVYSQESFFKNRGLGKNIIEILSPQYQRYSEEIRQLILHTDLIVIDGGGSMGTLWIEEEHKMQHIVQSFPENPIVIFPQTIFYSNDRYGDDELQKSVKAYTVHKNLHICARETTSFDFMKKVYPTVNVLLIPDIVLSLSAYRGQKIREGVVFCIRADKEKQLSKTRIDQIKNEIQHRGLKISNESTVIPGIVNKKSREKKLNEKWDKFSEAQLVITDRLHGMIFAAITSTPCIAFNNSSGKVGNVYKWISNLSYIKFINNNEDITPYIDKMLNNDSPQYNNTNLKPYYDQFFEVIEHAINLSHKQY